MGIPLKYDATLVGLKQLSNTELQYTAHQILTEFASSNTGTGTISVNPASTTGLTLIGTITDTERPYNIGDHPVGTEVVSITYDFYQDLRVVTNSPTARPVEFQSGASAGIKEQTDTDLVLIADVSLSRLVTDGLGSYRFGTSAPTVGGTWISIGSIVDNITGTANTVTYLWRRSVQTAPTTIRPLKYSSSPQGLKEMTDTEIRSLTSYARNRIASSGVGQYRIQSTAPTTGGTWIQVGDTFSDTRQQTGNVVYTGTYTGNYVRDSFSGSYIGAYSRAFSGAYQRFFSGFSGGFFTGFYTGFFSGTYTGSYLLQYAGTYLAPASYSGTYSGAYAGAYQRFFSGFSGGFFTGFYTGFYTGTYTAAYTGFYVPVYSGSYTGNYTGLTILSATETPSTAKLWIRTA